MLINGFGFVDTIQELGIEAASDDRRRAQGHPGSLHPAQRIRQAHVSGLLRTCENFIDAVKTGRGDRLKADDATLFSGLFWGW